MKKVVTALVAAAALACAGTKEQKKPSLVSDSDYGRLRAEQTQLVDSARADLGNARDGVARAKLRQTEAKQEVELAQADLKSAEAELNRAQTLTRAAKESNDPVQLERARTATESAELMRRAAEARAVYAKKLVDTRAAEMAAAERRVDYEEARVEQAKLHALQQANVPAATKYDAAAMEGRVSGLRREVEQADGRARALGAEMTNASAKWMELTRQLQARGGTAPPRG